MAYVRLTTLTPIHVGSGRIFLQNVDCLDFPQEKAWGIIDEHKILRIIGSENIDKWISKIENEQSIIDLIQSRKKDLKAADISLRVLKKGNNSNHPPITQELREQLHTHNHIPLLPGSSIKGGMRTAVFKKRLLADIFSGTLQISRNIDTNRKGEFVDKEIGKAILGKTPNDDPFRFIRISDFHFKLTEAWIAGSFNYNRWEDKRLKQWIELIPANSESYGTLDVGGTRYGLLRDGKFRSESFKKIKEIESYEELFKTINAFSKEMIEAEIKWAESKENLDEGYLNTLQEILEIAPLSSSKSCILRIGYGIGAKYMTGDWQETAMAPDLAQEWKLKQRDKKYENFEYPKTRRMLEGGLPLGFIRLDILDESEIPDLSINSRIHIEKTEDEIAAEVAPLKPEYYTGSLKKNIEVPALYIGPGKGRFMKVFKLLIGASGSEPVVEVRYATDLNLESYHWIKINTLKRNNTEVDSAVYGKGW